MTERDSAAGANGVSSRNEIGIDLNSELEINILEKIRTLNGHGAIFRRLYRDESRSSG